MTASTVSDVVKEQFSQASTYATSAIEQVEGFVSTLNTAAAFTVPVINMNWIPVTAPATVAPPSAVTLTDVDYTAPTPEPGELTLTPVTVPDVTFGETAPVTSFPSAPTITIGATPAIPAVASIAMPSAPSITLPGAPTLLSLSIPTFGGVDLHEAWLTKFDTIPTLTLVEPTPYSYSRGPEYASTLLANLQATLNARMAGGTGLDPAVEAAIWDRARSRETQTALANEADILRTSEAMGFPLPAGVVAAQQREAQQVYYDKLSGLSRDVAIKQAELEQENLKHTIDAGMALEGKLIDYSYQLERLAFEAAKEQADNAIQIHNAGVEKYKALLSVYQVYEGAYRTIISAELAKVDVFEALISAEQAKADINKSLIDQYKVEIEARMTQVEIFKAEVDGAKALVEIEGLKINAAGEQIKAFVAQINAETAKVEVFKAGVEAEVSKVQVYKVKADAFAVEAGVQLEAARVGIANLDYQVRAKALEWDGFKSKLEVEKYRMQGLLQKNDQLLTKFKVEGELGVAQYGSSVKLWEVQLKDYEAGMNAQLQAAKINGDNAMHAASVRADAAKVGAQVFAQLAGSAYSMIKVSAGIDYRGSLGVVYQYQNKTINQPMAVI